MTPASNGSSLDISRGLTQIGAITSVRPRIMPMLAILEPTALPTAISPNPLRAAIRETKNSGADVPMATMVRPISMGDMPKLRAVAAELFTKWSALHMRTIRPTISASEASNIELSLIDGVILNGSL